MIKRFETEALGANFGDAYSFLVIVTLLHEYVHYGDYNYNGDRFQFIFYSDGSTQGIEEGEAFEKDLTGGYLVKWSLDIGAVVLTKH